MRWLLFDVAHCSGCSGCSSIALFVPSIVARALSLRWPHDSEHVVVAVAPHVVTHGFLVLCAPSPVSAQVFYLENFSGYCEARLVLGTLVTEPSLWSLSLCQACREWHPEVGYDPTYRGDNNVFLCPRLGLASCPPMVVSCCFASGISCALHANLPIVGQGGAVFAP